MKLILRDIVNLVIISFKIKIKKPIRIAINNILKKFSFFLNLPEYPITMNPSITKNIGFNNSEI